MVSSANHSPNSLPCTFSSSLSLPRRTPRRTIRRTSDPSVVTMQPFFFPPRIAPLRYAPSFRSRENFSPFLPLLSTRSDCWAAKQEQKQNLIHHHTLRLSFAVFQFSYETIVMPVVTDKSLPSSPTFSGVLILFSISTPAGVGVRPPSSLVETE